MSKKQCLWANFALLAWFFLDMIGVYFGDTYLVTRSWKEDGIFFVIFVVALMIFIFKENIGKYMLAAWLTLWLITQFLSHELYTVIGGGENKIRYFEGSIKLIKSDTLYIPDLYHIILHILIVIALLLTIRYIIKDKRVKKL